LKEGSLQEFGYFSLQSLVFERFSPPLSLHLSSCFELIYYCTYAAVDFSVVHSFSLVVIAVSEDVKADQYDHLFCRDPSSGGGHHDILNRKFLVISGQGGGIGNYLVFYPAAYYFAAIVSSFFVS
jgi:hypothetical protein